MSPLPFQNQDCDLTLAEGVEAYRGYLKFNDKKVLSDQEGFTTVLDHDATHVIFGVDTSFEEEIFLNYWVLFGCTYTWKELFAYSGREEVAEFTQDLIKEIGYLTTAKAQVRAMPNLFRILIRTRKMKRKWPFTFPKELLSNKVSELREEYGVSILTPEERDIKRIKWSGLIEGN